MNKQNWAQFMQQAADGKLSVGFPEGSLNAPTELFDDGLQGLRWTHTPSADPPHPVTIDVYRVKSKRQAATLYKRKKTEQDNWKEWPKGFPDHHNDYMNVEHCGIQTSGTSGFAMWTQDEEKSSYLVVMTGGTGGVASFEVGLKDGNEYPDSIYCAISEAAKQS